MNILSENNIYTCSLHEFLPVENGQFFLLYAPLATVATLVSRKDVEALCSYLKQPSEGDPMEELACALLDTSPSESSLSRRIRGTDGFVNLSLLPNNVCNFQCSYCYSAAGRSQTEITPEKLTAVLDYFICKGRTSHRRLTISFLGGGEPLLSGHLVETAVKYANERAGREGFELCYKIVTNGSILSPRELDLILENRMEVTVSYEILEEIQNLQRKHFDRVSRNLQLLARKGALLSINAVITPQNVCRQVEMVEEVSRQFPEITYLSFEPLMELNDWSAEQTDTRFYDRYISHFLAARQVACRHGIELSCSLLRNVDCSVERYCAGEFAVCPDGNITSCPCISSPEMPHYESYVYGRITEQNEIVIDTSRLSGLLDEDVHAHPECRDCFAKWNCGGGCLHANRLEDKDKKQIKCDFVRKFTRHIIWERLKSDYENESEKPILDILREANA